MQNVSIYIAFPLGLVADRMTAAGNAIAVVRVPSVRPCNLNRFACAFMIYTVALRISFNHLFFLQKFRSCYYKCVKMFLGYRKDESVYGSYFVIFTNWLTVFL